MSEDNQSFVSKFLELKFKASNNVAWTQDETANLEHSLETNDMSSILAACCILVSKRPKDCDKSLNIIRNAIKTNTELTPYVELSIYEALTIISSQHLISFYQELLMFVTNSLSRRSINLDNTIFLLGRLARIDKGRALLILKSLQSDLDPLVQNSASLVLRGLSIH